MIKYSLKFVCLIYCFSLFSLTKASLYGQENLNEMSKSRRVYLNSEDSLTTIDLLIVDPVVKKIIPEGSYYWFKDNQIHKNIGGYSGQLLDGDYIVESKEGFLLKKGHYANGLRIGVWNEWHENGSKKSKFTYKEGQLIGRFSIWNNLGILTAYSIYKKNGIRETYRADGTLESKVHYKGNLKDGWSKIYNQDGELEYKQWYKEGNLIPKINNPKKLNWKFWKKKRDSVEDTKIQIEIKNENKGQ